MKNLYRKIKLLHADKKCRKTINRFLHILDYDDDILTELEKKQLHDAADEGKKIIDQYTTSAVCMFRITNIEEIEER